MSIKIRFLRAGIVLNSLIVAFSFSMFACSGGGGGGSSAKTPVNPAPEGQTNPGPNQNPTPNPNPVASGTVSLTQNFWCASLKDDQGGDSQLRLELFDGGRAGYTVFPLTAGARGNVELHKDGTWILEQAVLTLNFNGVAQPYAYSLVAVSPTGAAQLHLGEMILDPCN